MKEEKLIKLLGDYAYREISMNQKILVALTVIAIILGVLNLTLLFVLSPEGTPLSVNTPQDIPINYHSIYIRNETTQYTINVRIEVDDIPQTLYDCVMKVDYLTESGTFRSVYEYLGIVNFHSATPDHDGDISLERNFIIYNDFENDNTNPRSGTSLPVNYYGNNIQVSAYGYLKP